MPWQRLKKALHRHYLAPEHKVFKRWRDGFIYFCVGLASIYMANIYMQHSLEQELISLAGLLFVGLGFFIAMGAYIRLLISRFLRFFKR
ncbi:hypothetical protein [Agaribacterium haliotis]|uniref:hypothetical protein n=1 Tax=Agaribacterium haliotis TaxID=2013869 RepID=UPI000BB57F49|nr:hypothetical protein [Agaribacterium haliotis]